MSDRDRASDTVEIARFRFRYEAEMAAGTLADAGIPAVVVGDDVGGMYPGIMSVALRVGRGDAGRAREALASAAEVFVADEPDTADIIDAADESDEVEPS